MRTLTPQILAFLILSLFAFSCSSSEIRTSIASPTAVTSDQVNKPSTLIRDSGWTVPDPSKMKKGIESHETAMTESGMEVTVTRTNFSPREEYVLSDAPFSATEAEHMITRKLRLFAISELKIGGKPYSYIIMANVINEKRKDDVGNNDVGLSLQYVISDRDGDGKFETLYTNTIDRTVPNWAIENK
jgi:hypothetical protein